MPLFMNQEQERILGVAMLVTGRKTNERHIVTLPPPNRHPHLFRLRVHFADPALLNTYWSEELGRDVIIPLAGYHDRYKERQGFFTNLREFINRDEGLKVATAAGQLIQKTPGGHLFSEDLW